VGGSHDTVNISQPPLCHSQPSHIFLIMEPVYSSLASRALNIKKRCRDQNRIIVVLAGPPGSGKSTIAAKVIARLNTSSTTPFAAVIPMDGFHLSRATLDELPNSAEAYARRGASWTFDERGVLELVEKLSQSRFESSQETLYAPSFDHAVKDPVEGGIMISPKVKFVLLEGNYLLLDEEPWNQIKGMVDEAWFVDVCPTLAKGRIAKRHIKSGIEACWEDAVRRAESNDLLNGAVIREKLVRPDVLVESVDE
jgi:pantothenate kinase